MPCSTPEDRPVIDDRWVVAQRGPRHPVDPRRPYAWLVEPECTAQGVIEDVATVFITNRECPFRCVMCDLWQNTTTERVPDGAVSEQIEWVLARLSTAQHIKLYNAGNFFDGQAIPRGEWPRIADLVGDFHSVIVECHPRLVNDTCAEFADLLRPHLDVAVGLETMDPTVLPRLNKRMTLDDFERATALLLGRDIGVRAFILLRAPFQSEQQGVEWAIRSIEYAFAGGVECCTVIPTRPGNGALERLQAQDTTRRPHSALPKPCCSRGWSLVGVAYSSTCGTSSASWPVGDVGMSAWRGSAG